MKKDHRLGVLIILECFVLIAVFIIYAKEKWFSGTENLNTGISIADFSSDYLEYEDGWIVKADSLNTDFPINIVYGPFISLPRGEYTMQVAYDCESDQRIEPYSASGEDKYIESNTVVLDSYLHSVSYSFSLKEPVHDFEIRAYYNGEGDFSLYEISLFRSLAGYKRLLVIIFLCSIILDTVYINRKRIIYYKYEIVSIIAIIFLSCLPLMTEGLGHGEDIGFHLMRIDGLAAELRQGHFPVKIQSIWMHGNGHPISLFYGDSLLYIPALLRIAGFTINSAYIIFSIFINILTVVISYFAFRAVIKDNIVTIIMVAAYSLCTCRLVMMYWGSNVATGICMAFLPMAVTSVYYIWYNNRETNRPDLIPAILLSLPMTICVLSHIPSALILLVALFLFAALNIRQTLKIHTISTSLTAIVMTTLLTLFFIVPFLDYYINMDIIVTHSLNESPEAIQDKGLDILQLFSFFETHNDYNHTPGIFLMVVLVAALILWLKGKADRTIKILSLFSLFMIYISTNAFPWDWLAYRFKLFNYLAVIQFPSRYMVMACVSLTVLGGVMIKRFTLKQENSNWIFISAIALIMISPLAFYGQFYDQVPRVNYIDSADLDTAQYESTDYLRVNEEGEPIIMPKSTAESVGADVIEYEKSGYTIRMHVRTGDEGGILKLPLDNYKGYKAYDNTGQEFEISDDEYCKVSFMVPANYDGFVTVSFVEPWYWRAAEVISLISWIILLLFLLRIFMKKRINKMDQIRQA